MIIDTSVLVAFFDRSDAHHVEIREAIQGSAETLVVSPYVLAELDYMITARVGIQAELVMLRELAAGAWELPALGVGDLHEATAVVEKYADQAVGLTDASLVVLAHRYRTRRIATLDRRHFTVLRPLSGGRFTLVP